LIEPENRPLESGPDGNLECGNGRANRKRVQSVGLYGIYVYKFIYRDFAGAVAISRI
jgi:hypothetical protein